MRGLAILLFLWLGFIGFLLLMPQPISRKVDLSSCAWIVMQTRDVTYGRSKITVINPGIVECVEKIHD